MKSIVKEYLSKLAHIQKQELLRVCSGSLAKEKITYHWFLVYRKVDEQAERHFQEQDKLFQIFHFKDKI